MRDPNLAWPPIPFVPSPRGLAIVMAVVVGVPVFVAIVTMFLR